MDPNANLKEQLRIAKEIQALEDEVGEECNRPDRSDDMHLDSLHASIAGHAARLAELVLALNNWLARGGFPPTWKEV